MHSAATCSSDAAVLLRHEVDGACWRQHVAYLVLFQGHRRVLFQYNN